ncbi:MAG: hypothetical protein ACK4TM_04200 [Yoonia sp.]
MSREKLQRLKIPVLTGVTQSTVIIAVVLFYPVSERYAGSGVINWLGIGLVWICASLAFAALSYLNDDRRRS